MALTTVKGAVWQPGEQSFEVSTGVDSSQNINQKLNETVSVKDYGAVGDGITDDTQAFLDAQAATTGVVYVPNGAYLVSPSIAEAADIFDLFNRFHVDGSVDITLASGFHALTESVNVDFPGSNRVTLKGTELSITSITGEVSVTGSAKAYNVNLSVSSSANFAVGDYALLNQATTSPQYSDGTGDYYSHYGVWKVIAVDAGGANRITVLNTSHAAAWPTNTITNGIARPLKTVLQFTGVDGFRIAGGQSFKEMNYVAIVGDWSVSLGTGTTGTHGILLSTPNINVGGDNDVHDTIGSFNCGRQVGVSAWGEQGIVAGGRTTLVANNVMACSNRKRGMYSEGSSMRCKFSVCSGNGEDGFIGDTTGYIQAAFGIACGNGLNGFWSTNNSLIVCASSNASNNLANGYECRGQGRLAADVSYARSNAADGYSASDGGMIDADSATADNNSSDGFSVANNATVDCNNASSTNNTLYGVKANGGAFLNISGTGSITGNGSGTYIVDQLSTVYNTTGAAELQDATFDFLTIENSAGTHEATMSVSSIGDTTMSIDGSARIQMKIGQGLRIFGGTPTSAAGYISIGTSSQASVGAAGGASALPATPLGYLIVGLEGNAVKIPYYNL